jgi:hypothetical protein
MTIRFYTHRAAGIRTTRGVTTGALAPVSNGSDSSGLLRNEKSRSRTCRQTFFPIFGP